MKKKIVSVMMTAVVAAATVFSAAVPAFAADTVKIGVYEPASGDNGAGGKQETLGIQYANSETPTVEIDGKEYNVELDIVDNESSTDKGPSAASTLVSDGVSIVLGSYGSGVSIAASDIFKDGGVPALGISCTNPQITQGNTHYFRICFLDPFQGTVMANYAADQGYTKAAVIAQNGDDYSTGLAGYFKTAFAELGGEIVADETYNTNESDFNAILTKVKSADPDCIFIPSSIATATLILPQITANGIDAQVLAGDTWENAAIISKDMVGAAFSTFFDENDESNPVAVEFVKGFKEYLNSSKQNLTWNSGTDTVAAVSALGYDAYMAMYNAIAALDGDTVNSVAIRDALYNVNFDGVTGNITFNDTGDANKDTAYIKTCTDKSLKSKSFEFLKTQTVEAK